MQQIKDSVSFRLAKHHSVETAVTRRITHIEYSRLLKEQKQLHAIMAMGGGSLLCRYVKMCNALIAMCQYIFFLLYPHIAVLAFKTMWITGISPTSRQADNERRWFARRDFCRRVYLKFWRAGRTASWAALGLALHWPVHWPTPEMRCF